MDALQLRLQEPESLAITEGLSPEAKMLCELSNVRQQIKNLKAFESALTLSLKDHVVETGETITNGAQKVKLVDVPSYEYMDATLKQEQPAIYDMVSQVSASKVDALIRTGIIDAETMDRFRQKKITQQLRIVEDK